MKFFFEGTEHDIVKGTDPSVWVIDPEVYLCSDCGLSWRGRLVRQLLKKQIEELLEKEPLSKAMLHRGEWKESGVENLIHIKELIQEAIDLNEVQENNFKNEMRGDWNVDAKRTSES